MTGYFLDILYGCAGDTQKILMNLKFIDSIDEQATGEDEINCLSNLTGIAVFDRKHSHITFAADNRIISSLEVSAGNSIAFRENSSCCNMSKGSFDATVGNLQTILHPVLIRTGYRHQMFEIVDVVAFQYLILNKCGVLCNHRIFSVLVKDWQAKLLFMFVNQLGSSHTLNEQCCHLGVHFVYDFSCIL